MEELRKHIDVDVYGGCGPLKCQRNGTHWLSDPGCYDQVNSNTCSWFPRTGHNEVQPSSPRIFAEKNLETTGNIVVKFRFGKNQLQGSKSFHTVF